MWPAKKFVLPLTSLPPRHFNLKSVRLVFLTHFMLGTNKTQGLSDNLEGCPSSDGVLSLPYRLRKLLMKEFT